MAKISERASALQKRTPRTQHGCLLVGWALYEDGEQHSLFALSAVAAIRWLEGAKDGHTRTIEPVYSDTWFYGLENRGRAE